MIWRGERGPDQKSSCERNTKKVKEESSISPLTAIALPPCTASIYNFYLPGISKSTSVGYICKEPLSSISLKTESLTVLLQSMQLGPLFNLAPSQLVNPFLLHNCR